MKRKLVVIMFLVLIAVLWLSTMTVSAGMIWAG
jgi:hypothetical protein